MKGMTGRSEYSSGTGYGSGQSGKESGDRKMAPKEGYAMHSHSDGSMDYMDVQQKMASKDDAKIKANWRSLTGHGKG